MPLALRNHVSKIGSIYAHLFENERVEVPRALYWSVTLPCAPVAWEDQMLDCSVTCEWLRWIGRDWEQLSSLSLETVFDPALAESSVYAIEHHPAVLDHLSLGRVPGGARFVVDVSGEIDVDGLGRLDGRGIRFALSGAAEFEGVVVVPSNLNPSPRTEADVVNALKSFFAIENLSIPKWDRFRYVLAPVLTDA